MAKAAFMFQRETTLNLQTGSSMPAHMKSPVVQIPFQTGKFSSRRKKIHKNEHGKKSIVTHHGLWLSHFFKLFLFPLFWVLFLSICKGLFWISKASRWFDIVKSLCTLLLWNWKHDHVPMIETWEDMCIWDSILVAIITLCYWIESNEGTGMNYLMVQICNGFGSFCLGWEGCSIYTIV